MATREPAEQPRRARRRPGNSLDQLARKAEEIAAAAAASGVTADVVDFSAAQMQKAKERQVEVMALRLAGLTYEQIAARINADTMTVFHIVERALKESAKLTVDDMRNLENSRLDRLQAAIWPQAIGGDLRAMDMFLRISARRAALNGMNAAIKVDLAVSVRQEMEHALQELQAVVLGEVISRDDERAGGS